jgi:hypothetical protein
MIESPDPTETPVVRVTRCPRGCCLTFRCRWCRTTHVHGAGGGLGLRSSHCWRPGGPLEHGYVLMLAGETPDARRPA